MKKVFLVFVIAGMVQTMQGQMQEAVEKIRDDFNLMGLSVATVCDGKITGTYHAGLRDFERNLPVNAETKYRIASISKFVMTTAMMKLYDRKLLDLDEDVSTYLGFRLRNPSHPDKPIT
ncbi:MAG: serine hydrolase domain-containing protein, partial [Bacteroidales bacterium]